MPRQSRVAPGGYVFHVVNRGNCRMDIFRKNADFASFVKLIEEARRRFDMRILGYCLMHNHWHLVLWPRRDGDLSRFIQWLCTTHVRRWREHRGNSGEGHLYQGRYKSFIVECDGHLLTLLRYVEANPRRAKIVPRAQHWAWSSLGAAPGSDGTKVQLTDWPVDKPGDWIDFVNEPIDDSIQETLRQCLARGRPFGGTEWLSKVVRKLKLESTLRDPWRPRKHRKNKRVRRSE